MNSIEEFLPECRFYDSLTSHERQRLREGACFKTLSNTYSRVLKETETGKLWCVCKGSIRIMMHNADGRSCELMTFDKGKVFLQTLTSTEGELTITLDGTPETQVYVVNNATVEWLKNENTCFNTYCMENQTHQMMHLVLLLKDMRFASLRTRLLKVLMPKLNGKAEGRLVNQLVGEILK